ncbi:MAG: PTS sugar transporter subunit IIA [Planctomycetales bacterium]|nr:PTS sugar transporter subunit IIA [Planctomycetales bacterium]
MKLSEIIRREAILPAYPAGGRRKAQVIRDLVGSLAKAYALDEEKREAVEEAILAREAQKPTGIGRGVAVPHGKNECVTGVLGLLAICREGVDFQAPDAKPAKLIVLMVSDFSTSKIHVAALAQITRLLQRPELAEKLLAATTADQVSQLLKQNESELAA